MPLLDHFHSPLKPLLAGFHNSWMTFLAGEFNRHLPPRFFATPSARFGIEVDVGALERIADEARETNGVGWTPSWTAPAAAATVPFAVATDELEVLVHEDYPGEFRLVGAMEFVGPANKDRPDTRDAFVSKCHGYLHREIGLVIVDVVTDRRANLHNDLMARLGTPAEALAGHLYATAYRPSGKNGTGRLDIWREPLAIASPLPTLPLWLYGGINIPADLELTYDRTCREMRVYDLLGVRRPDPTPSA